MDRRSQANPPRPGPDGSWPTRPYDPGGDAAPGPRSAAPTERLPPAGRPAPAGPPMPAPGPSAPAPGPAAPRPRRPRFWLRRLVAAAIAVVVLLALLGAGLFLYLKRQFDHIVAASPALRSASALLSEPAAGRPAVFLVIGTDRRRSERGFGRSDTLMLVRVDPAGHVASVLSIPRSTPVIVPGHGPDLVNAAYSYGGPALALRTVEHLTGVPVNYLVVVGFDGFKGVIDAFGGVYVDIDHRYLYKGPQGPVGFEPIDLHAGYQLLDGREALAFSRDRHADDDYFRIARQQLVVRELRRVVGRVIGSPLHALLHLPTVMRAARAVARSVEIGAPGGRLGFLDAARWGRALESIPPGRVITVPISASDADTRRAAVRRFLDPLPGDTGSGGTGGSGGGGSGRPASPSPPTVVPAAEEAAAPYRRAQRHLSFAVRYPGVVETTSVPEGGVRHYTIDTGHGRLPALRATYRLGGGAEYWGIEETTWSDPPLLQAPTRVLRRDGREYRLYANGSRLHVVAFEDGGVTCWVSNTLFDRLSNATMLALARSLRPLPAG